MGKPTGARLQQKHGACRSDWQWDWLCNTTGTAWGGVSCLSLGHWGPLVSLELWGWDFDRMVAPVKLQENKEILGFPQLQCSSAHPWQWGGWGGTELLPHKLTESSETLIRINTKQRCFSHRTSKCLKSFSEVSYPVPKHSSISISQNFVCCKGKTPQNFNESTLAEGNHFTRNFLTSHHCTIVVLHLPAATIRSWWLHLCCTDEKRACVGIDFSQHRSITESSRNT